MNTQQAIEAIKEIGMNTVADRETGFLFRDLSETQIKEKISVAMSGAFWAFKAMGVVISADDLQDACAEVENQMIDQFLANAEHNDC